MILKNFLWHLGLKGSVVLCIKIFLSAYACFVAIVLEYGDHNCFPMHTVWLRGWSQT